MIELVVFDADGVLFDSFHSNIAYYNAIFAQVGEPPLNDEEEIDSISMATALLFDRRARGNAALIERMNQVSAELEFAPFFELLKPPFDLRPFMIELKKRYKLGLATNRSATVPALVRHLRLADTFDAIASARDENVRPKPAPDILELCMRRANAVGDRSVYVGDSQIDQAAAAAASMHFIGVGTRLEALRRIADLSELPARMDQWFG
jgi:phosphoglycolate phosphatase